jgi:ribosomal protein S18 acetylase RimI-like enzyme
MKQEQDSSDLTIRIASLDEVPIVLDLWKSSGKWLQSEGIDQWNPDRFTLEDVLSYFNNGSIIYLAELDNEIVGTYLITWSDPFIWKELDNTEAGYIHRLAVYRRFKGTGIGLMLLKSAEKQIKLKGKNFIRLDCMADNVRLNQYYRDAGYEYIRRVDGIGWSANLYEKK